MSPSIILVAFVTLLVGIAQLLFNILPLMQRIKPMEFADFTYKNDAKECGHLNERLFRWIYETKNYRLIGKYHKRYLNNCVPPYYHAALKKLFKDKMEEFKNGVDAQLSDEEVFNEQYFAHYNDSESVSGPSLVKFHEYASVFEYNYEQDACVIDKSRVPGKPILKVRNNYDESVDSWSIVEKPQEQ